MGSTVQPRSATARALHGSMVGRARQDPASGDQYTGAMGGRLGDIEGKRGAEVDTHRTGGEFASGSMWEAEE